MRRKITDAPLPDADELPDLTLAEQIFVKAILDGKTAADAWRLSHPDSIAQDNTIWARASEMRNSSKVQVWLTAARKAHLGDTKVTLENHVAELERLREIAIASGNIGAAVQAEQLRGKAKGHYTENLNISHNAPENVLDEIRKLNPALAAQLEQEHLPEHHGQTLQ